VIDTISPHLLNQKNTVREGAVTVLLNFSIIILQKDDHKMRMQIITALGCMNKEADP